MTKEDFMREAIKLSLKNVKDLAGWPFGAVIVKDGKIVGEWSNQVMATKDPTAHSEIVAIREACKNLWTFQLDDCEIYTNCEPCPMCYEAISWARIEKIYYANAQKEAADLWFDDNAFYEDIKKDFRHRHIPVEQLLHDEALEVFKEREWNVAKVPY